MKAQMDNPVTVMFAVLAIASLISMDAMLRIDGIVNGNLHQYGLQVSREWANPYLTMTGIVFSMGWFIVVASLFFDSLLIIRGRRAASKLASPGSEQSVPTETPAADANLHQSAVEDNAGTSPSAAKAEGESQKNEDLDFGKMETTVLLTKTEDALNQVGVLIEKLSELTAQGHRPKPAEKKKEEGWGKRRH